ncbi:hypothetical protein DL240_11530 [Lujinxingia litoralis]|uniref:Uncharacterized protein n=1 Tax=Lujinxingia litoralis TaxID=2211119 RepID=A0A328C5F6_9DELT|nr:MYXO-CTERM sorting domain-containing protein [Lujinxingia litoralis]RAL22469.1 hypothetical protein DL240_11530 [Lujinxingia litoralis]
MGEKRINQGAGRVWRAAILAGALAVVGCDGGCDMEGFSEVPFPEEHVDKTMPLSAEVRLSSHGLAFMSEQVPNLIGAVQEGGLSFCVPPSDSGDFQVCHEESTCDDGTVGCQLDLTIEHASLTPQAPNVLEANITVGNVLFSLPVEGDLPVFGNTSCWLDLDRAGGERGLPAQVPARVPIRFEVDHQSPFGDLRIEVGEVEANVNGIYYTMSGRGGDEVGCPLLANVAASFLDGTLKRLIADQLNSAVQEAVTGQVCQACGAGEPACKAGSTCQDHQGAQVCVYDNNQQCVPRMLGMEGALEMGAMLGEFSSGEISDIFLTARLADRAVADSGLSLAMRAGFQPQAYETCVPVDPTSRPSFEALAPSPTINSDLKPDGTPFMFGLSLSRRALQHLMWSLWSSGALCISVGSAQVDMLTTNTIGGLVPSVRTLTTRPSPMTIALAPQQAPDVRLGANVVRTQGNDREVEEGLLILDWKDVDLHMYGFVQERQTRLFTLRTDIELPIAVTIDAQGNLFAVIGDVEGALQNIRVLNDELLAGDAQALIDLLPTLMGFALPALTEALADPIELPEFMGYRLLLGDDDIQGIDGNENLGLFANLEFVGTEAGTGLMQWVEAAAGESRVIVTRDQGALPRVEVELEVQALAGGFPAQGEAFEYVYRVDGGLWHLGGLGPKLRLDAPALRLQGEHRIELRTRALDAGARWQQEPTEVLVVVDYEAPTLELSQLADRVEVLASDLVAGDGVQMRYRWLDSAGQGVWSAWGEVRDLDAQEGVEMVEVQVRDAAGQTATETLAVRAQGLGSGDGEQVEGCGGCASGSGQGPASLLLMVGMLLALRWRRRLSSLGWVVALVALSTGCSGDASEACASACAGNESCVEGACVPLSCESQADCPEGFCEGGQCVPGCTEASDCSQDCGVGEVATCGENNQCICEPYCAQGCSETQYCCEQTNRCTEFPDWCAEVSCEPGFEPKVTNLGNSDPAACEATGGTCECVALPPIPMGYWGAYAGLDSNGDLSAVSGYNLLYRDLMMGVARGGLEVDWVFVDGPPSRGRIRGAIDGPRGGRTDVGDQVGTHSALAIDDEEVIHIFYRDEENKALKYARGQESDEGWAFEKITLDDEGDAGYSTAVLRQGAMLHLFYVVRVPESDASELRYRQVAVDAELDTLGEGSFEVLYQGSRAEAALVAHPTIVALHVQPRLVGERLFVGFYDNTRQQGTWMWREADGQWGAPSMMSQVSGAYVSLVPDSSGQVHAAYMDEETPAVAYLAPGATAPELVIDGIRDTAGGWSVAAIGEDVKIFVGEDGAVRLFFHDATHHRLMTGVRAAAGGWTVAEVAGSQEAGSVAHGFYTRAISWAQGGWLVSDMVIDTTVEPAVGEPRLRIVQ